VTTAYLIAYWVHWASNRARATQVSRFTVTGSRRLIGGWILDKFAAAFAATHTARFIEPRAVELARITTVVVFTLAGWLIVG